MDPSLDCFSHEPLKRQRLDWTKSRYLNELLSALRGRSGTSSECGEKLRVLVFTAQEVEALLAPFEQNFSTDSEVPISAIGRRSTVTLAFVSGLCSNTLLLWRQIWSSRRRSDISSNTSDFFLGSYF